MPPDGNQDIKVPLPEYIHEAARVAGEEAARVVLRAHIENCSINSVATRVGDLEQSRAKLIGIVIGASAVATFAANLVASWF